MRHKVPKCVANVWQWRTPAWDRSATAGYLSMVYTVYKGVGLGIGVVAVDLHDTAQAVTNTFTSHRHFSIIVSQFD